MTTLNHVGYVFLKSFRALTNDTLHDNSICYYRFVFLSFFSCSNREHKEKFENGLNKLSLYFKGSPQRN